MKVCDICKKGPEVDEVGSASITFQVAGGKSLNTILDLHKACGEKLFTDIGKTIGAAVGDWMQFLPIRSE